MKTKSLMKSMGVSKDSKHSCTWHEVVPVNQVRELGRLGDNECLTEIQLAAESAATEEMKLAILAWERRSTWMCGGVGANGC